MASSRRRLLLAALAAAAGGKARADEAPPSQLQSELVKTGLYLIRGGGGNTLLRFSANGLVLVNGKSADSYKPLMSQVHKIDKLSDMPVRVLILTDVQDAEAANSARFAAAKVPILVQADAAVHLTGIAPAAIVTYDSDFTVKLGGIEVQVKHFGKARGDGEAVVYFPDMKIVAVGDLYLPEAAPLEDAGPASLRAWSAALEQLLQLDFEQVVPNNGPTVSRKELMAFKGRIEALTLRASASTRALVP